MKIQQRLFILVLSILFTQIIYAQDLLNILTKKFGSENVIAKDSSSFKEYYEIKFHQPIDHSDLSKGFFKQIILLGHNDFSKPMIIETNGYEILPYQNIKYISEPAKILTGNQIIIEHRYFGRSIPDSTNNDYLDFKQIASDCHNIKDVFDEIYKSDWISTGASKGGVTALNYSFYYPHDIAASFVYVAPVLEGIEDKRITTFLKEKRSSEIGQKLFAIQKHLLEKKQTLLPKFLEILRLSGMEIGTFDPETLYDFTVLEFDFNYWQYISDFSKLTDYNKRTVDMLTKKGLDASLLESQNDLMVATLPTCIWYLLDKPLAEPFFYQSFTQMGSYGYEEELFTGLKLTYYSPEFLAGQHPKYSKTYSRAFNRFLKKQLKNTILIYGAEDPWTACKANVTLSNNNLIIVNPKTNHSTLIKDISETEKKKVKEKLREWIGKETIIE